MASGSRQMLHQPSTMSLWKPLQQLPGPTNQSHEMALPQAFTRQDTLWQVLQPLPLALLPESLKQHVHTLIIERSLQQKTRTSSLRQAQLTECHLHKHQSTVPPLRAWCSNVSCSWLRLVRRPAMPWRHAARSGCLLCSGTSHHLR